jgi:hypothetical protein
MEQHTSNFCWDQLETPPRIEKYEIFFLVAGALFEKVAHSDTFNGFHNRLEIF